jgi:type IV pilus assembly protein PilN
MYGLDINFLNDRPEYRPESSARPAAKANLGQGSIPLVLGAIAGLLLPGMVFGLQLFLQGENARLTEESAQLDARLAQIQQQIQQVEAVQAQAQQVATEADAFARVFQDIKPVSALLQDIRDRTPAGVQVQTIQKSGTGEEAKITISGYGRSFNDVNDFLLLLQQSPFLDSDGVLLNSGNLQDNPTQVEIGQGNQNASAPGITVKLPQVVGYQIEAKPTAKPANELLRDLERKGAVGLVTRIRTLQQKGVI